MIQSFSKSVPAVFGTGTVFLLSNDSKAWYFVRVPGAKIKAFRKAVASGSVDLALFGDILSSGFGAAPSEHILERMEKVYGFKGEIA